MDFNGYHRFCCWLETNILPRLRNLLGSFSMIWPEHIDEHGLLFCLSGVFSNRNEPLKDCRQKNGCQLISIRHQVYGIVYDDAAKHQLSKELQELFPDVRIRRFKAKQDVGFQIEFFIPYSNLFDFAEKQGLEGDGSQIQCPSQYLKDTQKDLSRKLKELFELEYADIKFVGTSFAMHLHFSDLYPEDGTNALEAFEDAEISQYCKSIAYTDTNKHLVEEKLKKAFPHIVIECFKTGGSNCIVKNGITIVKYPLIVDCTGDLRDLEGEKNEL